MASNLFGIGSPSESQTSEAKEPSQEKRIFAIYPAIIEDAFARTMDNYRKYIATYNFQTEAENDLIRKHNLAIDRMLKEKPLTTEQRDHIVSFRMKFGNLNPRDFNNEVDQYVYGKVTKKKTIQTVKYQTELIFQNFLHLYNSQLMKQNERYMKGGIITKRPIQEFKVNSYLVTSLKRNEVNSIDVCRKTVRNHRQRLEEAGVFIEYHFAGRNRAVELHINPEILVVLDIHTMKIKNAEKQRLTLTSGKLLLDNNESTGTLINKIQKKENVCNNSQDIRSSSEALTPSYLFFTGTHASKQQKNTAPPAEKSVKIFTFSDKLREQILHPQDLAQRLTNNEFVNYKPIDIRDLHTEAHSGTLTREEFRELCIQDFFKSVSKIWKESTPFIGSWKIAINQYYHSKWMAFNGFAFNKVNLVDDISQMRWRIEWSRKWFTKHPAFKPLFPSDYFDFTRKTNREVGFEYTKKKWQEHLTATTNYDNLRKKQEKNSKLRKETINHAKKCEMIVNRFLKNKITYSQLYDYVEKNLPSQFHDKIPIIIEQKTLQDTSRVVQVDDKEYIKYSFYEF